MLREISHMPVTMDRKDTSLTVAEPLGMLEAGRKKTRYFSYPPHFFLLTPRHHCSCLGKR